MKFGSLLEFHKVPEWYTEYLDYIELRNLIDIHKQRVKQKQCVKLEGVFSVEIEKVPDFVDYNLLKSENPQIPQNEDEVLEDSNKFTTEWIHAWLVEIERIEKFFTTKRDTMIDEFILLQDKFRIKTDIHEQDRKKAQRKLEKKAAKKGKIKAKQMSQIDEIIDEENEEETPRSESRNEEAISSAHQGTARSLATDKISELSNNSLGLNPNLYALQTVHGIEQVEAAPPVPKKRGRSQSFDGGQIIEMGLIEKEESDEEHQSKKELKGSSPLQFVQSPDLGKKQSLQKRLTVDASVFGNNLLLGSNKLIDTEKAFQDEEEEDEEKEEEEERFDNNKQSSDSISISMSSVSSSTLLPMHQRYRNKRELEVYSRDVLGKEKLDTYIVPDIEKILTILKMNMQRQVKRGRNDVVDEFQHMINWKRVFEHIWMQIRWLNSFAHINELALRKILKKFIKNFFDDKDTPLKADLTAFIKRQTFHSSEGKMCDELQILSDDLLKFYADCFKNGKVKEARVELDQQQNQIRRVDLILIALTGGMMLMLVPLLVFLLFIDPGSEGERSEWSMLTSSIEVYFFGFVITFILAATGVAVQVFKDANINYMFIFEIDQHYRLVHHQFYRLAMIFGCVWSTCLVWQILQIKHQDMFPQQYPYFTFALVLFFVLMCCMPIHACYLKGRIELARAGWNILISPFGQVRFRHFFLADIITSMTACLETTATMGCFMAQGKFKTSEPVEDLKEECSKLYGWKIVVSFLPYWWRFAQCLHKYHQTKLCFPHLVNAGKYSTSLIVAFAAIWLVKSDSTDDLIKKRIDIAFWVYLGCKVVNSSYSLAWDILMDWGLFRQNTPGHPHRFLRDKINYRPWFYFFSIFTDALLRFWWILPLFNFMQGSKGNLYHDLKIMLGINILLECYRRAQWALIRVENEQNNNFEQYRTIPIIPPIVNSPEEEQLLRRQATSRQ